MAALAERARLEAIQAEQDRKARLAAELDPKVQVRVGRNASFVRLQFDWTVPTKGEFAQAGELGAMRFEWPVSVDLTDFTTNLPAEVISATNDVSPDGSTIDLEFAKDVKPRFFEISPTQYYLDIDIAGARCRP